MRNCVRCAHDATATRGRYDSCMIEPRLLRPEFLSSAAAAGVMFDLQADQHPTVVSGWNQSRLTLHDRGTHFGFAHSGETTLISEHGTFLLRHGMYFAVPGPAEVQGTGAGFVASRVDYRGFFHVGGPVEETGRLRYIDGCSDSLLIAPVMHGDPCLNLLHIPPHTNQTAHTHPSLRTGMVISGEGSCRTPQEDVPLTPGLVFVIPSNRLHSFHTQEQSLRIVAWHPDSDFGPTHGHHPMVNRTLVDGRPVNATGEEP